MTCATGCMDRSYFDVAQRAEYMGFEQVGSTVVQCSASSHRKRGMHAYASGLPSPLPPRSLRPSLGLQTASKLSLDKLEGEKRITSQFLRISTLDLIPSEKYLWQTPCCLLTSSPLYLLCVSCNGRIHCYVHNTEYEDKKSEFGR